jgi:hypothetical protein
MDADRQVRPPSSLRTIWPGPAANTVDEDTICTAHSATLEPGD